MNSARPDQGRDWAGVCEATFWRCQACWQPPANRGRPDSRRVLSDRVWQSHETEDSSILGQAAGTPDPGGLPALLSQPGSMVTDVFERLSLQARAAIERASIEASRVLSPRVEPVHLVLGLLDDKASLAARALLSCGLTLEGRRRFFSTGIRTPHFDPYPSVRRREQSCRGHYKLPCDFGATTSELNTFCSPLWTAIRASQTCFAWPEHTRPRCGNDWLS